MDHTPTLHRDTDVSLEGVLSIWPVTERIAAYLPAGDLITLSRSNLCLRANLHGVVPPPPRDGLKCPVKDIDDLRPPIGYHQTSFWARLKSKAIFECSSSTHTRGQKVEPCIYCSTPICDACIVRDSMKNRNEHTYQHRLRYFCAQCWAEGNRTKSFRFPTKPRWPSRDEWSDPQEGVENAENDQDSYCGCTLKDNGWLCLDCKKRQNASSTVPIGWQAVPARGATSPAVARDVECYGLDCHNVIDLQHPDRDRRRICLWCQRPLRRQFGGEDRHAWNMRMIEVRAMNAESRSRDIEEYHRKRRQQMSMSRWEFRGVRNSVADEKFDLVRHLDTMNYRNYMDHRSAPTPQEVWMSKRGIFRYSQSFLHQFHHVSQKDGFKAKGISDAIDLQAQCRAMALPFARTNRELTSEMRLLNSTYLKTVGKRMPLSVPLLQRLCMLKARILNMYIAQGISVDDILETLRTEYGCVIKLTELEAQLRAWNAKVRRVKHLVKALGQRKRSKQARLRAELAAETEDGVGEEGNKIFEETESEPDSKSASDSNSDPTSDLGYEVDDTDIKTDEEAMDVEDSSTSKQETAQAESRFVTASNNNNNHRSRSSSNSSSSNVVNETNPQLEQEQSEDPAVRPRYSLEDASILVEEDGEDATFLSSPSPPPPPPSFGSPTTTTTTTMPTMEGLLPPSPPPPPTLATVETVTASSSSSSSTQPPSTLTSMASPASQQHDINLPLVVAAAAALGATNGNSPPDRPPAYEP